MTYLRITVGGLAGMALAVAIVGLFQITNFLWGFALGAGLAQIGVFVALRTEP